MGVPNERFQAGKLLRKIVLVEVFSVLSIEIQIVKSRHGWKFLEEVQWKTVFLDTKSQLLQSWTEPIITVPVPSTILRLRFALTEHLGDPLGHPVASEGQRTVTSLRRMGSRGLQGLFPGLAHQLEAELVLAHG
jgi:hypothetical protein